MLIVTYRSVTQSKHINKTEITQKQRPTTHGKDKVLIVTFYEKFWRFLYTVHHLLINWPLSRASFRQLRYALVAVALVLEAVGEGSNVVVFVMISHKHCPHPSPYDPRGESPDRLSAGLALLIDLAMAMPRAYTDAREKIQNKQNYHLKKIHP